MPYCNIKCNRQRREIWYFEEDYELGINLSNFVIKIKLIHQKIQRTMAVVQKIQKIYLNISRCFFFKTLIFRIVGEIKGQKMAQNDKRFCLSHSLSPEAYII